MLVGVDIINVYSPESALPESFPKDKLDVIENILEQEWSIFNGMCGRLFGPGFIIFVDDFSY